MKISSQIEEHGSLTQRCPDIGIIKQVANYEVVVTFYLAGVQHDQNTQ